MYRCARDRMLAATLLSVLPWVVAAWPLCAADTLDLEPRPMTTIRPGTVIEEKPPIGWSHLVVKNQPRLDEQQADKVLPVAADLARSLFGVIVANVHRDRQAAGMPFRLEAVAAGVGTRIAARDTIVTADTQEDLGADLNIVARMVLSRSEDEIKAWTQVARGPNIAVLDALTRVQLAGKHEQVLFRYCLLVDPRSGRLVTFLWLLRRDEAGVLHRVAAAFKRLPNNLVHRYPLVVDEEEVTVGVPNSQAFAMGTLPEGAELPWPPALEAQAALARFSTTTLALYERELFALFDVPGKQAMP
ncbi:MAG: hypothetical protein K1X74_17820 [Pirellulales bacterium]|nr:hypothetical protein [Pirellulales bacterium]